MIPERIREIARNEGCNTVKYCGMHGKWEVYGVSEVGEDGLPVPVGLPTLVLWDGHKSKIVTGEKALNLSIQYLSE